MDGTIGAIAYLPLNSISYGHVQVMYDVPAPAGLSLALAWAIPAAGRRRSVAYR
jgi:hypothetical protein